MKKNIMTIAAVVVFSSILAGCAGNSALIAKASISLRQDVFQEVQPSAQTTPVKTVLNIEFPVKNYRARFVNSYSKHTDPPYTIILNIDGQTTLLSDEPVFEKTPGDLKNNPEAGSGWKYNFRKTVTLQSGRHKILIAAPLADVVVEKEINVLEGENTLKLSPVYITPITRKHDYPRFLSGLQDIKARLNNQDI